MQVDEQRVFVSTFAMGRLFIEPLAGPCVYFCGQCDGNPISAKREKESSAFHGRYGKAMLLKSAHNCDEGPLEDRSLMTGLHLVCDLYCRRCHSYVGWKYLWTAEASQQYKVGKVILERNRLSKHEWEN